jgi:hypothetical protein
MSFLVAQLRSGPTIAMALRSVAAVKHAER